MGLKPVVI